MIGKRSRKPAVADVNRDNARRNIVCKKNILEAWARNGIPQVLVEESNQKGNIEMLEYFPRSIRQFNFWDGTVNSQYVQSGFPTITRNANDTLRNHPVLREEVEMVIDALIAREAIQQNQSKPIRIKKLTDASALERKLRTILENDLANLRKQQGEERRRYIDEVASLRGQVAEMKAQVRHLKTENQGLSQQVRDLKGQLVKVLPLKGV